MSQQQEALRLVNEYRPTMPHDVLNSWAQDAKVMIARLHAENEALRAKIAESRTPLTTDQKLRIALDCNMRVRTGSGAIKFAAAIEAAHGINP